MSLANATALLSRTALVDERIEAWIESGTVPPDATEDPTTLLEAARRYVDIEVARRARSAARVTERAALMRAEADEKLQKSVRRTVEGLAVAMRVAWTSEILGSRFSVGHGESVTWGEATVEQHELRATKLERLAAGDLTTAAMHRAAIATIQTAGSGSLANAVV